jgi:hypothetical protein
MRLRGPIPRRRRVRIPVRRILSAAATPSPCAACRAQPCPRALPRQGRVAGKQGEEREGAAGEARGEEGWWGKREGRSAVFKEHVDLICGFWLINDVRLWD